MSDFLMNYKKPLPPSFYPSLGSSYTDNTNMAAWIYNFEKNHLSDLDKYEIEKNQLIKEFVNAPLYVNITVNDYTIDEYGYYNFYINELLDVNTITFSIVTGSYITDPSGEIIFDNSGNQIISNDVDSILISIDYQPENSIIKVIPLGSESVIVSNIIRIDAQEYLGGNTYYSYFLDINTNNTPN